MSGFSLWRFRGAADRRPTACGGAFGFVVCLSSATASLVMPLCSGTAYADSQDEPAAYADPGPALVLPDVLIIDPAENFQFQIPSLPIDSPTADTALLPDETSFGLTDLDACPAEDTALQVLFDGAIAFEVEELPLFFDFDVDSSSASPLEIDSPPTAADETLAVHIDDGLFVFAADAASEKRARCAAARTKMEDAAYAVRDKENEIYPRQQEKNFIESIERELASLQNCLVKRFGVTNTGSGYWNGALAAKRRQYDYFRQRLPILNGELAILNRQLGVLKEKQRAAISYYKSLGCE